MKIQTIEKRFELFFLILFMILAIGTPLVFTSLTRSVFEVNKMLLLRIVTIVMALGWIVRSVLYQANGIVPEKKTYRLGIFSWTSIGLEVPLLIFTIFDIVSTVFSQNIRLSVIGAYDRWEGILTALNYIVLLGMTVKLVTRRYQMKWILFALLVPCAMSGIYGVFQSLGFDFMQWSVDPTKRVFACINNPVHFCAYMGMMVPVGIATLLYVSSSFRKSAMQTGLKWFLFAVIAIIYYAQYLSFSRATWFGFALALPVFFLVVLGLIRTENAKAFIRDFFVTLIGIVIFYMYYIFNFHMKAASVAVGISVLTAGALVAMYLMARHYRGKVGLPTLSEWTIPVIGTIAIFFAFIFNWTDVSPWITWVVRAIAVAGVGAIVYRAADEQSDYLARIVTLVLFATLQFVAVSFTNMGMFAVLLAAFYWTNLRGNQNVHRENKFWLFALMLGFAVITAAPALPELISSTFNAGKTEAVGLGAVDNVQAKLEAYKKDAQNGSARVSMWKTSVPWIKEYWLIGSGLDTIKYMYPVYRRSDYGILEGGHNFTPDRLHNEYLNNLATRGVIATLVYYIGVIIGWYLIVLRGMVKLNKSPMKYFVMAFMTGATVYLGQVLFNFGVVATMVLFYTFMGLAWAIVTHSDFEQEQNEAL